MSSAELSTAAINAAAAGDGTTLNRVVESYRPRTRAMVAARLAPDLARDDVAVDLVRESLLA